MTTSRRTFITQSAAAAAGVTFGATFPARAQSRRGPVGAAPSDQLNVGVIGAKGMGWSDMRSHLKVAGVNCVALADVDQGVLAERTKDLAAMGRKAPQVFEDYRRMLERKDIDAVIVGTPDHWHCLAMTDAVSAGKHVYVEKPIANSIEECRVMQAAAKRSGRMVQVGQWQRSGPHYESAIAYVRSDATRVPRRFSCARLYPQLVAPHTC